MKQTPSILKNLPVLRLEDEIKNMKKKLDFMRPAIELLELEWKELYYKKQLDELIALIRKDEMTRIHREVVYLVRDFFGEINEQPNVLELYSKLNDAFIMLIDNAPDPLEDPEAYENYMRQTFPKKADQMGLFDSGTKAGSGEVAPPLTNETDDGHDDLGAAPEQPEEELTNEA